MSPNPDTFCQKSVSGSFLIGFSRGNEHDVGRERDSRRGVVICFDSIDQLLAEILAVALPRAVKPDIPGAGVGQR